MRRRLYFLLPDVEHCKSLVTELKEDGLTDHEIHVMARSDIELEKEGLHEASVLEKSEFSYGLELGIGVGGAAGLLGGLLAVTFPPAGIVLGGGAVLLGTTLVGAGFGSLVSMLVASDIPNHELENFQNAISMGQLLLILDVPTSDVNRLIDLIKSHHPEAEIGVTRAPKSALSAAAN